MATKETPAYLLALGKEPVPESVEIAGASYRLVRVFKHDFFAATSLFEGDAGKIVLKIGRRASLFGFPLGWIGRWHANHETKMYQLLADLPVVPDFIGRYGRHGFAHAYIEGQPLKKGVPAPDDFFEQLRAALTDMHSRGVAYVDLEKCENVLWGDDGKPYLIDFQIAWRWPWRFGANIFPVSWITRSLCRSDFYHVRKLQRRVRPDQLTEEELRASYAKPWYVRWYGKVTRPITLLRRRILARIAPAKRGGERGRIAEADK